MWPWPLTRQPQYRYSKTFIAIRLETLSWGENMGMTFPAAQTVDLTPLLRLRLNTCADKIWPGDVSHAATNG